MSGNCDSLEIECIEFPTKGDYKIILNKIFSNQEKWFLIISLFWRYEFD